MEPKNQKTTNKAKFDATWENPIGKVVIITVSAVALVGLAGVSLKILAFTTNSFKDLRDAIKR